MVTSNIDFLGLKGKKGMRKRKKTLKRKRAYINVFLCHLVGVDAHHVGQVFTPKLVLLRVLVDF